MKDVSPPVELTEKQAGAKGHGFGRTVLLIGAAVVLVVLALSLGLGLGLGLKHYALGILLGHRLLRRLRVGLCHPRRQQTFQMLCLWLCLHGGGTRRNMFWIWTGI
jgi:Flp pilus assembly protein TadB